MRKSKEKKVIIYGIHACKNAVEKRRNDILQIYVLNNKPIFDWLENIDQEKIMFVSEQELGKIVPKNSVHQNVAIKTCEAKHSDISALSSSPKNIVVAMLDGITDPQNLGSIIRSAAAFGISGIILPEKSSCKMTGVVAKAASGGIEYVTIYTVKNLVHAIEKIQSYGFWVFAFCECGDRFVNEVNLQGKVCLVFGAEGAGIRKLVQSKSDFTIKIPTNSHFKTLNVSTSAAIGFYEAAKQNQT